MNREELAAIYERVSVEICGGTEWCWHGIAAPLERFAALVVAAEREKVARFIIEQCFSTGRSDSIEGMLDALVRQVAEREREACAKVCNDYIGCEQVARDIRARGEKP